MPHMNQFSELKSQQVFKIYFVLQPNNGVILRWVRFGICGADL